MRLNDKRFWIVWLVLLILAIVSCMAEGWNEDTALLGATYTPVSDTQLTLQTLVRV